MYYFIVNPDSRSGRGRAIWEQLKSVLLLRGIDFKSSLTQYAGHACTLAAQASLLGTAEHPVCIVAVGGDGTIYEVLTGIQDFDHVIFGYIPTGSGNDFCRSMGLPQDPQEALDSILKMERIEKMDVPYLLQDGRKYRFGISTGIGYDAGVCQEVLSTPLKRIFNRIGLGKLTYLIVALRRLVFITPGRMRIQMDGGRDFTYDRVYFTAVMNQKYEGGGFMFCPDARPDDGLLDVIVIQGVSKLKLLCCLPTAFFGKHTHIKGIHIFQCKSIDIHSDLPMPVHKDGESGGIRHEISVSFEKKPLKIILPVI